MTILDKFVVFAKRLPGDQREYVEEALEVMMASLSAEYDFTFAERAELERRMAQPDAEYADPADIRRIFGKPFRG